MLIKTGEKATTWGLKQCVSGVIRNLEVNYSVDSGLGKYIQTSHIRANKSTSDKQTSLLGEGLKTYHLEKPLGRFVYKTNHGILYDKQIESLDELGQTLVNIPDLYRCIVKRYMAFLTGANVDLSFRGDMGEKEVYLHNLINRIAINLQAHQDLRETLMEIIESPLYTDRYYLEDF